MFKLRPYQQEAVAANRRLWSEGVRNPCTVLPTGAGKCHRKGTPILMFDGSIKKVEDVQVGDKLMGPDSTPRTVLALGRGTEMMYEVAPVKGEPYYVNESHILSLRMTGYDGLLKAGNGFKYSGGEVVNISVLDYLKSSKTFKHCAKGWRVGVEFEPKTTHPELPPYMLGIWLGDGTSRTASITTADGEVVEYLSNYAVFTGQNIRVEEQENNASNMYHILNGRRRDGFGLIGALRHYDLLMNKHIPVDYLTDTREKRLELLAGILDSDGYLANGYYDVVFKVKKLADDTVYLARSLGFAAYVKPCNKTCTNTGATGLYYRISISGDVSVIPTMLSRHQAEVRKQVKDVLRVGLRSVSPVGVEPYYGFEIDGDHLYLLGDFTVTHNTVVASELIRQEQQSGGYFAAIAHRQELVGQISLALARQGVMHDIVAPRPVVRFCSNQHVEELGQSFYSPSAPGFVGGVDTVIRREMGRIKNVVSLLFQDECHHVLRDNKWGKAAQLFPKANGLYVTATPLRADGKGLGRHADGVFDELIIGPSMRDLIRMGSLTDYRIFAPPTDIDLSNMVYGADGDYSRPELVKRAKKSGIIGDVVSNYEKYCENMQTVVFTVDVEQAHDIAKAFEARGIRAVALSANNTDKERQDAITAFRRKEIQVIVNVDLLGEGFDCPAIEAVIMARPTASYGLYVQVFGRALRLLDGKLFGLIIDMVGNVKRHGLPDAPRQWSLDRREKRGKSDANDGAPVKTCPECMGVYQIGPTRCPYCGHVAIATGGRGELVVVDAELRELTPEELAQLRGEADKLTREWAIPHGASKSQAMAIYSHNKTVRAQAELRDAVALWAGALRAIGFTDDAIHVMMHRTYGTNVSALQVMRPKEAGELKERIMNDLKMLGVA